jgi:hypothetical protein
MNMTLAKQFHGDDGSITLESTFELMRQRFAAGAEGSV